jgi:hypothetical protein
MSVRWVLPAASREIFCLFGWALLAAISCTEADVYRLKAVPLIEPPEPPDSTAISTGTYCASSPDHIVYPVKLLVILDDSGSMSLSDANFDRTRAARELANALLQEPGYYMGVEKFQDGVVTLMTQNPVFSDNLATVNGALANGLHAPGGATPIKDAISRAATAIQTDILQDPDAASNTRYIVLLLSDGVPQPGFPPYDEEQQAAQALHTLPGAGDITIHTAYLQAGLLNPLAEELLQKIADIGNGEYKSFPAGDSLDFSDFNVESLAVPFVAISPLLITNLNARPGPDGVEADSDADGLSDRKEYDIGTDPTLADTDGDACSDLVEHRDFASDPLVAQHWCSDNDLIHVDEDGDLLNACMEELVGTDDQEPDSDKDNSGDFLSPDNMTDMLEVTWDLIPRADDANQDYDSDGSINIAELLAHTDPWRTESEVYREAVGYDYQIKAIEDEPCYDFTVSNIALANTLETDEHAAGENILLLYFVEAPKPTPTTGRVFKVLKKVVTFDPTSTKPQTVTITAEDFAQLSSVP